MSYRNPQIINDQSGMIMAEGIAGFAGSIAKSIDARGKKLQAAKEKKEKEDAVISKQVTVLANQKIEGDSSFVAGLTDLGESIASTLGTYYEGLTTANFDLKTFDLEGKSNPQSAKQISANLIKMEQAKALGIDMIATTQELPDLIDNYEAVNKTIFLKEMPDPNTGEVNTNLAKAIIWGFSGEKGYKASMEEIDGELYAVAVDKDGTKYSIPSRDFKNITENLTLEKKNNAAEAQIQFTSNELRDGKGNLNQSLINEKIPYNRPGSDGIQRIGTRNLLNLTTVETAKKNAAMDTQALLTSVKGNTQLRNLYLADLNIDSADYEDADEKGRVAMVVKRSNELFDKSSGLILEDGNYYVDIEEKSYKIKETNTTSSSTKQTPPPPRDTDTYTGQN